jgi:hypothetical protein
VNVQGGVVAALFLLAFDAESALAAEGKAGKMERLSDDALREGREAGNAVALVHVLAVDLHAAGTRSEYVTVQLQIERVLCGSPPEKLTAWSFTSKGDTLVTQGQRYVMVLVQAQGYARFGIGDRVEVLKGEEAQAVELHQKALAALGPPKP